MLDTYKDVLTVRNLYDILPIGKTSIYKLLNNNTIKSIRVGNKFLIPKQSVIDFIKSSN